MYRTHRTFIAMVLMAVLGSMLALAGPARAADITTWNTPADLSPTTGEYSSTGYTTTAASANGKKVVTAWTQDTPYGDPVEGSTQVVQAATSDDGGVTWNDTQTVSRIGHSSRMVKVASSADGQVLSAVYAEYDQAGYEAGYQKATVRTSTDGGQTWGERKILSDLGRNQDTEDLSIAVTPDGSTIVATWRMYDYGDPSDSRIQMVRSTDSGATWSDYTNLTPTYTDLNNGSARLAMSGDGSTFMQFWNTYGPASASYAVSTDKGETWSDPAAIPQTAGGIDITGVLSQDGRTAEVVWTEYVAPKYVVRSARTTNGGRDWTVSTLSDPARTVYNQPGVAMSADGSQTYATWGYSDQAYESFVAKASNGVWGTPELLSKPTSVGDEYYTYDSRPVTSSDGSIVTVAWFGGLDSALDVVARTSSDGGQTWGDEVTVSTIAAGDGATYGTLSLVMSGNGARTTAAWSIQNSSYLTITQAAGGTVPVPEFAVAPAALDFGEVAEGTTVERDVNVLNDGTAPFTVTGVAVDGADAAQYTPSGDCTGATVDSGGICTLTVTFTPTSAGAKTAELSFTADTATTPVALSGTGTAAPVPPGPAPGPTPGPKPGPDNRKPQEPANAKGIPPKKVKTEGQTVLTGRNARTSAGQLIRTRVRATPLPASGQGEVRYYRIIRGPQGKVSIRTYGYPLKIVVVQTAAPTKTARAYFKRTVYLDGVKR